MASKIITTNEDDDLLALDALLSDMDSSDPKVTEKFVPKLKEDSTFIETFGLAKQESPTTTSQIVVQKPKETTDEIDSSDDDEVRNFLERKYNEYGCDINNKLKQKEKLKEEARVERQVNAEINKAKNEAKKRENVATNANRPVAPINKIPVERKVDVFTDPVFGFRIINPLISSALLIERMKERKAISFANLPLHAQHGDYKKDWVIAGVIVAKNPVRMTKKDEPFSIWRLSDLRGDVKMLSLFLFGGAHKELWKTN